MTHAIRPSDATRGNDADDAISDHDGHGIAGRKRAGDGDTSRVASVRSNGSRVAASGGSRGAVADGRANGYGQTSSYVRERTRGRP